MRTRESEQQVFLPWIKNETWTIQYSTKKQAIERKQYIREQQVFMNLIHDKARLRGEAKLLGIKTVHHCCHCSTNQTLLANPDKPKCIQPMPAVVSP